MSAPLEDIETTEYYLMHVEYRTPLTVRYASSDMSKLFGDLKKYSTWRKLWIWLATAEKASTNKIVYFAFVYMLIETINRKKNQ